MTSRLERILAVTPLHQGFAFAVLETGPLRILDWGMREARTDKNIVCRKKAAALIYDYRPTTLVLENPDHPHSHRRQRVRRLIRSLRHFARAKHIRVAWYSREDIRATFKPEGASSRYEIAVVIGRMIPELHPWLPKQRAFYENRDLRLEVFDAVALGLTYARHSAQRKSPCG